METDRSSPFPGENCRCGFKRRFATAHMIVQCDIFFRNKKLVKQADFAGGTVLILPS